MKTKIGAIILREGKILAVRKKRTDAFIIPGGQPKEGETSEETLKRELKEELGVDSGCFRLFGTFVVPAMFGAEKVKIDVYIADIEGEPKPCSEIEEIMWLGKYAEDDGIKLGTMLSQKVLPQLIEWRFVR